MYRQGDVLIAPHDGETEATEEHPRDARGRVILAAGEATGHHHAIRSKHARLYATATAGLMVLEALRRVTLRHEEHAPIVLPPGKYLVRRQREYIREGERWVAD